jgi:hypothetical protein
MVERRPLVRRLTRQEFLLLGAGAGVGFALAGCDPQVQAPAATSEFDYFRVYRP